MRVKINNFQIWGILSWLATNVIVTINVDKQLSIPRKQLKLKFVCFSV
jgi:hypothetical protein